MNDLEEKIKTRIAVKAAAVAAVVTAILTVTLNYFFGFLPQPRSNRLAHNLTTPQVVTENNDKPVTLQVVTENNDNSTKPPVKILQIKPRELINWSKNFQTDYELDKAAKALYYGKTVEWKGYIIDISSVGIIFCIDDRKNAEHADDFNFCVSFDSQCDLGYLRKGQQVTCRGKIIDIDSSSVSLDSGEVISSSK